MVAFSGKAACLRTRCMERLLWYCLLVITMPSQSATECLFKQSHLECSVPLPQNVPNFFSCPPPSSLNWYLSRGVEVEAPIWQDLDEIDTVQRFTVLNRNF